MQQLSECIGQTQVLLIHDSRCENGHGRVRTTMLIRCHSLCTERIDLAKGNAIGQSAGRSESERARGQYQKCSPIADGQSEFFAPVSRLQKLDLRYCCRQLSVSIVVSVIAVFRLVDDIMPSRSQIALLICFGRTLAGIRTYKPII